MNREYIFKYKDYNIMIYNKDIYEEFYMLRDINIFYSLVNENQKNKRKILEQNDQMIKHIKNHITIDCSFGYGICGLGYMYYFMQTIDKKYELDKKEIDIKLIQLVNEFIKLKIPIIDLKGNFNILYDYYRGISGIYAYVLQISQNQNIKDSIVSDLIIKISEIDFKKLNIVNQSIAHGISVILNLLRLNENYKYTEDDIRIVNKLMIYIQNNLEGKIKYTDKSSLSWGNGDFGTAFSIILLSMKLNIKLPNNFFDLLRLLIFKGNQEIFSKYNPCNGFYGYNRMIELISSLYNNSIAREQFFMKKNMIKNDYTSKEFSIIDGILSSILINNTMHDELNEYYKLFML